MPASRDDLMRRLAALGIATGTVDHPPVFTVAEARALRGRIPGGHSKNLFLKDRKGGLFLLVAEEASGIDLKTVHTALGARGRVSFGSADLLMEVLGVPPGSVTPFSVLNDRDGRVRVFLDAALAARDPLNFHPLENTATTTIATADLLRFLEAEGHPAQVVDVAAAAGDAGEGGGLSSSGRTST